MKSIFFICLIFAALAAEVNPGNLPCTKSGYNSYLKTYTQKCIDCDTTSKEFLTDENNYITSCKYIKAKNSYTAYTLQLSYLSDFSDEEIDGLFDIAPEYTGEVSYCDVKYEGDELESEVSIAVSKDTFDNDLADVPETKKRNCTTSWATQTIRVAEYDLQQKGHNEKLSVRYLYQCMREEYGGEEEDGCRGFTNNEIYTFIQDHGLMTQDQADIMGDDLCKGTTDEGMIKFTVEKLLPCSNKYTLMKALSEEKPMMVLLALDRNRARHLHDISDEEDAPYTGAYDQPTTWGIVTGYKQPAEGQEEGVWNVQTNFNVKETVLFKLPMRDNETNANYAGIAAYAFYLDANVATEIPPTTEVPPTTETPLEPTTEAPTTEAPTTEAPTTEAPTTEAPTTEAPTTMPPTTEVPTTETPTTEAPTTVMPTLPPRDLTICYSYPGNLCKEDFVKRFNDSPETYTDISLCGCDDITEIDFTMLPHLRTIHLMNLPLESFTLDNMQELTSVKVDGIGEAGLEGGCTRNNTISISNNPVLTELIIGQDSFMKFCSMEVSGNHALTYLGMGAAGCTYPNSKTTACRYNTGNGAFLTATEAIIADMPELKEIHAGGYVLYSFQNLVIEDLTSLEVFQVFGNAFQGVEAGASMTMKNISPLTVWSNEMVELKGSSFINVVNLDMEDCKVPYAAIQLVELAFSKVPKGSQFPASSGFQQWFDEHH